MRSFLLLCHAAGIASDKALPRLVTAAGNSARFLLCEALIVSGHVQYFVSTHLRASVVWRSHGRITVNLDPNRFRIMP